METCNLCGNPLELEEFDMNLKIPQYMKKHHVCFKCAFWEKRLEWDGDLKNENKTALITPDWSHYIIRRDHPLIRVSVAFGGTLATTLQPVNYILAINRDSKDFVIYLNNNITHQGTIPEHLRALYQVNARFLSLQEYKLLQDKKRLTYEYCKNIVENGIF